MNNEKNKGRVRFLEGKRLFITPMSIDDLDTNYRWDHDREMQFLDGSTFKPVAYEKYREEFEAAFKSKTAWFFSIILIDTGEHIGNIVLFSISDSQRSAEWGLKLDRQYRNKGYGTEAALLLIRYVFDDLGFVRLESGTHSKNPDSIRLQEKLGFVREGVMRSGRLVNGEYLDSIQYGMLREDYDRMIASQN